MYNFHLWDKTILLYILKINIYYLNEPGYYAIHLYCQ